jgi:hypothetical protein
LIFFRIVGALLASLIACLPHSHSNAPSRSPLMTFRKQVLGYEPPHIMLLHVRVDVGLSMGG